MNSERVDIVDESDRVVGCTTRQQMREGNLLHRCVAVLCLNSQGQVYVHRRTEQKDLFPAFYDTFVGGVVSAGERYDSAAVREIAKELGIVGPGPERLFMSRYEGPETRSHTAVYRVLWDGPIRHQESEVAWGAHLDIPSIVAARDWRFVPDGWAMFQEYLRMQACYPGQAAQHDREPNQNRGFPEG